MSIVAAGLANPRRISKFASRRRMSRRIVPIFLGAHGQVKRALLVRPRCGLQHAQIRRSASITTLTMKSQPAVEQWPCSLSCTGLPSRHPFRAFGVFQKVRPMPETRRPLSKPARPGQITSFRPPEKPAMKCGSISPVVILQIGVGAWRRIDPNRRACDGLAEVSVLVTGWGRDGFRPGSCRPAKRPTISTNSSPEVRAIFMPVATRIRNSRDAECRRLRAVSRIGGRRTGLGTGLVTSQTTTHALRRPGPPRPTTLSRSARPTPDALRPSDGPAVRPDDTEDSRRRFCRAIPLPTQSVRTLDENA